MTKNSQPIRYDILADWLTNLNCNFACDYCPQVTTNGHKKSLGSLGNIETIAGFFDSTKLTWLIHMSGGEPFLHPDFISLCKRLTEKHYISINSNIVSTGASLFAEALSPERVAFLHASLHYGERKKRGLLPKFIETVKTLENAGFNIYVTQVFYPPIIGEFRQLYSSLAREDIFVHPKIFRGFYQGRLYPQEYSESERMLFEEFSREASGSNETRDTHINPDHDLVSLSGFLSFKGSHCLAGDRYVHIDYRGNIYRCYMAKSKIGNIADKKFTRLTGGGICPYRICPCSYYGLEYARDKPKVVRIGPLQKRLIRLKKELSRELNGLL